MSRNYKIAELKKNSIYVVDLIDNWDGTSETKEMTGL